MGKDGQETAQKWQICTFVEFFEDLFVDCEINLASLSVKRLPPRIAGRGTPCAVLDKVRIDSHKRLFDCKHGRIGLSQYGAEHTCDHDNCDIRYITRSCKRNLSTRGERKQDHQYIRAVRQRICNDFPSEGRGNSDDHGSRKIAQYNPPSYPRTDLRNCKRGYMGPYKTYLVGISTKDAAGDEKHKNTDSDRHKIHFLRDDAPDRKLNSVSSLDRDEDVPFCPRRSDEDTSRERQKQ